MLRILLPRGLAGNPRSELDAGFGVGAGRGEPRVWVGQALIIACPVITWQTVLVSQAGLPTVSAVEQIPKRLSCPPIHRFGLSLSRTLQLAAGEEHSTESDVILGSD